MMYVTVMLISTVIPLRRDKCNCRYVTPLTFLSSSSLGDRDVLYLRRSSPPQSFDQRFRGEEDGETIASFKIHPRPRPRDANYENISITK